MATNSGVTWAQWLVRAGDARALWAAQPTYLLSQAVFLLAGAVTLLHAFRKGGRWPYLWLGALLHGLLTDNLWHLVLPEFDNFWHSQTPVMLLGGRLPLHIVFLYPAFLYHAAYAVSRLRLPRLAEPCAVGLAAVLIDLPYDIVAVKFVHWTWHDTDPNIFDRHYWVPWNSYYFHASFAASFYFFFQASRSKAPELKALAAAALLGLPGGVLLFAPIYHPLHDVHGIHSEVTFFLLFAVFAVVVVNGLLSEREKAKDRLSTIDYVLIAQLALHYIIYWVFVVLFRPEREWSLGLHEPVGPCDERASLTSPLGQTLPKRKYLCADDYDEGYFDFACVGGQRPAAGAAWYVVCGTPFQNRVEYITVISTVLIAAAGFFYGMYFKTQAPRAPPPANKLKTK